MKRFGVLLLSVLLMLGTAMAWADALPEDALSLFEGPEWAGYEPVLAAEIQTEENRRLVAAVMSDGERNILVGLSKAPQDEEMVLDIANAAALYQGDLLPTLSFLSEYDLTIDYEQAPDGMQESYSLSAGDYWREYSVPWAVSCRNYEWEEDGKTRVVLIDHLYSYQIWTRGTRVNGREEWDSSERFYTQKHKLLSNHHVGLREPDKAPSPLAKGEQRDPLPEGTPVSIIPGTEVVPWPGAPESTTLSSEKVQLLCGDGPWAFIRYGEGETAQYGYVPFNSVEGDPSDTPESIWRYLASRPLRNTHLLDRPDGETVMGLGEGAELRYLATVGSDWSYVQVVGRNGYTERGFVKSEDLYIRHEMDMYETPHATGCITVKEVDLIDDPYRYPPGGETVLATLSEGTEVGYNDTLYLEWDCIIALVDGEYIEGFVPRGTVRNMETGKSPFSNG